MKFTLTSEAPSPSRPEFRAMSKSQKVTQGIFSLLQQNPDNTYSVKDLASQCGCGYLTSYRACRALVAAGAASYIAMEWPTVTKRGLESVAHRVGVTYCAWYDKMAITEKRIKELESGCDVFQLTA